MTAMDCVLVHCKALLLVACTPQLSIELFNKHFVDVEKCAAEQSGHEGDLRPQQGAKTCGPGTPTCHWSSEAGGSGLAFWKHTAWSPCTLHITSYLRNNDGHFS